MKVKSKWLLLALPTIVAALVLIVLLNWHLQTRVRITLKTDRAVFKVGGEDKSTIIDSIGLKSIIIEKFESIKLKPESLTPFTSVRDAQAANHPQRNPSGLLTVRQQPVVIRGREGRSQSNVSLSNANGGQQSLLSMDSVHAKPSSELTLESAGDPGDLIVRIDGQESSGKITVVEPIKLSIDQCDVEGLDSNLNLNSPLTLRAKLLSDSSIEFNGQQNSLLLTVSVPTEKATNLFPQGRIPVTAVKFERLNGENGSVVSSLLKNSSSEITYPDYHDKIDKVSIDSSDFLYVDELHDFYIEGITYNPEENGVSMTLHGKADKIMSGAPGYYNDLRLTIYDALWHNNKVIALFAVLCWVAVTTGAFYKFFKET